MNKTSGWYEMFYRGYDPAIGRMLQVDPYAPMYASFTTYNYAINNPVMINDPNGGQIEAPPGVSQMGYRRNYLINNPDGYTREWAESFDGYVTDVLAAQEARKFAEAMASGGSAKISSQEIIAWILEQHKRGADVVFEFSAGTMDRIGAATSAEMLAMTRKIGMEKVMALETFGEVSGPMTASLRNSDYSDSYPKWEFEVIFSAKNSFHMDWFIERRYTAYGWFEVTDVVIFYNTKNWGSKKYGQVTDMVTKTRQFYMDAGGWHVGQELPFNPSNYMKVFIQDAIDYHCEYCSYDLSLWDKFINAIRKSKPTPSIWDHWK